MSEGRINGGPAMFVRGDGERISFDFMKNGRGEGLARVYYKNGLTSKVISNKELTNTSGWAYYVG